MRQWGLCNLHKVSGSAVQKFVQHFPLTKSARYGIMVISPRIGRARPAIITQADHFVNTFFEKKSFFFYNLNNIKPLCKSLASHSKYNRISADYVSFSQAPVSKQTPSRAKLYRIILCILYCQIYQTFYLSCCVLYFIHSFQPLFFFLYIVYHIFLLFVNTLLWKMWALCPQSSFHFFVLLKAISQNFLFD